MTKKTHDLDIHSEKSQGYYENPRFEMLNYIPENCKRSVEFGCGTGGFSSLLKTERNAEAWAVEIHKESADEAATKLDRVINADAMQGVEELPDAFFDCAVFLDVLEHLVDPYELLRRIKTKIRPDSVIICSIPNIRYYRAFKKYVFGGDWKYEDHGVMDKTHLRFFTKKSLIRVFSSLDYEITHLDGVHPTSSRTYKLLNLCFCNALQDVRYKHYIVVAKPRL
ncbi:MAG: class I SAM-dependent methyltransferase [Deltaproteobacteria bacterium]|nr:class I SAM-dependent methyltransferase [Deltaproteobacteria bacterium]